MEIHRPKKNASISLIVYWIVWGVLRTWSFTQTRGGTSLRLLTNTKSKDKGEPTIPTPNPRRRDNPTDTDTPGVRLGRQTRSSSSHFSHSVGRGCRVGSRVDGCRSVRRGGSRRRNRSSIRLRAGVRWAPGVPCPPVSDEGDLPTPLGPPVRVGAPICLTRHSKPSPESLPIYDPSGVTTPSWDRRPLPSVTIFSSPVRRGHPLPLGTNQTSSSTKTPYLTSSLSWSVP